MTKPIQIAIAEDHDLVRKGIVSLLKEEANFEIIGDFSNGNDLIAAMRQFPMHVVILDIEMPQLNGLDALQIICEEFPEVKVIMLSMHESPEYISECMSLGAKAFLPKNCDIEELILAINTVFSKGFFFNEMVSKVLLDRISKSSQKVNSVEKNELTEREEEIVVLICEGYQNKEIADQLCLSVRTIEVHRKNISKKLNATNIAGLIRYAVTNGLYTYETAKQ
jgi:DNA-binding NarL/FixJ family response regulator